MRAYVPSRSGVLVAVLVVALTVSTVGVAAGSGTLALSSTTESSSTNTIAADTGATDAAGAASAASTVAATDEVTFVAAEEEASTSNDYEVPAPANIQEGDLLVMTIGGTSGEPLSQRDDGWTRIDICSQDDNGDTTCKDDGQDLFLHTYYKVASSDEPSEYDVDARGNTVASVTVLRGADTDDPIQSVTPLVDDGDEAVSTCPSTEGVDGGMLLCSVTHDDQHDLTNWGDLTLRSEGQNGDSSTQVATKQLTDGGDTDVHTPDEVDPTGNKDISMAVVVRPAGSDGGSDDGSSDDGSSDDGSSDDGGDDGEALGASLDDGGTDAMTRGDYLESASGDYRLYFQESDGNLVLRDTSTNDALWASDTADAGGTRVTLQGDGNLVMYTDGDDPVWASDTAGSGADELVLEDDGALVLYDDGSAVWSVNGEPSDDGDRSGEGVFAISDDTIEADYQPDFDVAYPDYVYFEYSINGGDWQYKLMDVESDDHFETTLDGLSEGDEIDYVFTRWEDGEWVWTDVDSYTFQPDE